jgi:uncharacterized protein YjiK
MKNFKVLILCVTLFYACEPKKKNQEKQKDATFQRINLPYNFESPSEKYDLPDKLKEISGLSYYKKNQLICVNDEEGKIFIYDINEKKIIDKIPFGKDGDYEGVEVVGDEVFVLKSNGTLKGFKIGEAFEREIDCSEPEVIEYEGLGYDPKSKYLLLVAKERTKEVDVKKMVYAYNFDRKVLFKHISIPQEQVTDDANGKDFRPSGIAVHPKTGQIFILASDGKKLLILSEQGQKEALVSLNPKIYRQPEGICFSPNGDLFISSEGKKGDGYILRFIQN